jgi:hypothetical protein
MLTALFTGEESLAVTALAASECVDFEVAVTCSNTCSDNASGVLKLFEQLAQRHSLIARCS